MTIQLDERGVIKRRAAVSRLLRPLRKNNSPVGCDFDNSAIGGGRVLAAHDGPIAAGGNYRLWFFRTSVDIVRAQYFEVWLEVGGATKFELHRAYLHLFRVGVPASELREVVALHADPAENNLYKKGPHIHVTRAEDPLPHCHFALNLDRVAEVTSTIESLDSALQSAIRLVADEVLGAYRRAAL